MGLFDNAFNGIDLLTGKKKDVPKPVNKIEIDEDVLDKFLSEKFNQHFNNLIEVQKSKLEHVKEPEAKPVDDVFKNGWTEDKIKKVNGFIETASNVVAPEKVVASHTEVPKHEVNLPLTVIHIKSLIPDYAELNEFVGRLAYATNLQDFTSKDYSSIAQSTRKNRDIVETFLSMLTRKYKILVRPQVGITQWNKLNFCYKGEESDFVLRTRKTPPTEGDKKSATGLIEVSDEDKALILENVGKCKALTMEIDEILNEDGVSMSNLLNRINEAKKKDKIFDLLESYQLRDNRYQRLERRYTDLLTLKIEQENLFMNLLGLDVKENPVEGGGNE